MKKVAIIQARMGSSRLPGKVLAEVGGAPMLEHVVSRVMRAREIDQVVVATSVASADDAIEELCARMGTRCVRGSEDDVLDRFREASHATGADVVVRVTADCPLIEPEVIDLVVDAFDADEYDYVSNVAPATFPDGLDTEVFSSAVLERAWREADLRSEREHVTPYLRTHPDLFRLGNVAGAEDWSHLRWTVDEPSDLDFVREVYSHFGTRPFGWRDVLALVEAHPDLTEINARTARNAGYTKSVREDTRVELPENQ